ncbi:MULTISPECIES: DUF3027 domain-containing protein [unclassified Corynebacterium]|uniref:DUF3027 domain-containing protein n=1 Tax=Corynebacterium TaxID=1716 RepID=UPI00254FB229|nr:DUF3027 domain-containing protein [Corynebacterium sp. MSK072]MDK8830481.1 DUF3027 domain-containing protein [Corynebacterium sp. MSK072]
MRGVSKRKANPLIDSRAVRIAREALEEVGEGGIGKHRGVAGMGRNVVTHRFAADMPGYPGWEWQAVLACAEGSRYVTVNEVALVPGGEALQAPEWVPYEDRVLPGDLGPGDLMPPAIDDERLNGNELSAKGLADAKQRWQEEYGPTSEMAAKAHLQCRTCAFYMRLMDNFGVCANEYSADGRVVHARYGCGAHSQTRVSEEKAPAAAFDDEKPIYQDFEFGD